MSERLARLSLRFVVAIALLGCLVPELPFGGQVHAATQPVFSVGIPLSGTTGPTPYGTFTGQPGTTISVGPNGVITVSGAAVHVTPNQGYVLARFNPGTGQWQAVPNNTIPPGTGATYALISGQPVTIPSSGHMSLARGTVTGPPGTAVTVGSTGVITVSGTTQPVQVTPSPGYVLALYNPTTGQWQVVSNNTIVPGTGTYALISRNSVSARNGAAPTTNCAANPAPASKQKGKGKATAPKRKGKGKATAPKRKGKGKATAPKRKGKGKATAPKRKGKGKATAPKRKSKSKATAPAC